MSSIIREVVIRVQVPVAECASCGATAETGFARLVLVSQGDTRPRSSPPGVFEVTETLPMEGWVSFERADARVHNREHGMLCPACWKGKRP